MNNDNRSSYLIKKKKEERKEDIDEQEINDLIQSSALLVGLQQSKSNFKRKINSIARWKPPSKYTKLSSSQIHEIRKIFKLELNGDDIPYPLSTFKSMNFPSPILDALEDMNISHPTPIQMQGLPIALSGRDMIGISFTGTGKSLVFILSSLMLVIEEEMKLPIESNDGPFAMIIVPSRELAVQLHETLKFFIKYLINCRSFPLIHSVVCIGGIDIKYQIEEIMRGCHIVVGTPGRLSDLMEKRKLDTQMCKFVVLDEADRLLDMGFDEEIRKVLEKFTLPHQTLIFSSTLPKKIQEFAKEALYKPIVLNIGRAGSVNNNVQQDVEFVKDESKLIQLLDTLHKTPPPVIIFCENKNDVEEIHEYLLLKGLDVCSMHGDRDQEERNQTIRKFREGLKDILVATDIVSKGIDFPNIEHVINYDMSKEVENYVLRIGRTGRLGNFGLATTYVNRNQDEAILLDLKHLLIESDQKIPAFLLTIHEEDPSLAKVECSFCGVLGHRPNQCHKLENQRMKSLNNKQSSSLNENLKYIVNGSIGTGTNTGSGSGRQGLTSGISFK